MEPGRGREAAREMRDVEDDVTSITAPPSPARARKRKPESDK